MNRTVRILMLAAFAASIAVPSHACWDYWYDDWYYYDYYDSYGNNGSTCDFENYDDRYDYENYEDSYDDIYLDCDHNDSNDDEVVYGEIENWGSSMEGTTDELFVTGHDNFWDDPIFQEDNSWMDFGNDDEEIAEPQEKTSENSDKVDTDTGNGGHKDDSPENYGIYDDSEDVSQYTWTLDNILRWVMERSNSIRLIVEELQKNDRIKVDSPDNLCHYYEKDHSLHVPAEGEFGIENILHEIIHLLQDENGILNYDKCSADNEYQVYVLNYILNIAYDPSDQVAQPYGAKDMEEWQDFKETIKTEIQYNKGDFIYTDDFINSLNSLDHDTLSEAFRDYYEIIGKENYYKNHDPNYNYNWEKMLHDLGFKKKKQKAMNTKIIILCSLFGLFISTPMQGDEIRTKSWFGRTVIEKSHVSRFTGQTTYEYKIDDCTQKIEKIKKEKKSIW